MAELADDLTPSEDDRLDQAEALVRAYCGWHIAPSRTETVVVRGAGRRTLMLPSLYVTDIASVTDDETLLTDEDDYTWSSAGVVTAAGCFSRSPITVAMTHGYSDVPPDVTAVVQSIAQRLIGNPTGLKREQAGPFVEEYGGNLSETEMDSLRAYRIPTVA